MLRSGCFPGSPGYPTCNDYSEKTRTTLVKEEIQRDLFAGYHTEYWDRVSSYTLSKSNTLSFGFNYSVSSLYGNFSAGASVSFSDSVGRTYTANQFRRSKLAAYVDVRKRLYKVDVLNSYGEIKRTYYYTTIQILNRSSGVVYE